MTTRIASTTKVSKPRACRTANFWLGKALPIAFFAVQVEIKVIYLVTLLAQNAFLHVRGLLEIGNILLSIIFLAMVCALFMVRKRAVQVDTSWLNGAVGLAGSFAPYLLAFGTATNVSTTLLIGSSSLLLLGNLLTVYSLASLGRSFGIIPAARGLVTSGPYRFVRHPLYVAEAIAVFGLLLTMLSPLTIALYIGGQALQVWRAANEERILVRVFPEYRAYMARTGRFLPRVWFGRKPYSVIVGNE